MFFKKSVKNDIPGDYQHRATYNGHISQRIWHLQKHALIGDFLQGKHFGAICDAGCGSGTVSAAIAALAPRSEVVGLDLKTESIEFAKHEYGALKNLRFDCLDLIHGDIKGHEGAFDLVVSMEVIEHFSMAEVAQYLDTLKRLGTSSAVYLITTPDYRSLWPVIEWGLDAFSLVPKMAGAQHLSKFTYGSLTNLLCQHGFECLDRRNFCGISPFLAAISQKAGQLVYSYEEKKGWGNLLCFVFRKIV